MIKPPAYSVPLIERKMDSTVIVSMVTMRTLTLKPANNVKRIAKLATKQNV